MNTINRGEEMGDAAEELLNSGYDCENGDDEEEFEGHCDNCGYWIKDGICENCFGNDFY